MSRSYRTSKPRPLDQRAVRSVAGQLGWLDGRAHWLEGRVVWERDGNFFDPSPVDFARAQRNLNKLAASARTPAGVAERYAPKLELAKRLFALRANDLPALARESRSRNPAVARRLTELLVAEAVCANSLPIVPSRAVLNCGKLSIGPIRELLADESAPPQARAMAALVSGAWGSLHGGPAPVRNLNSWSRRAFRYGDRRGLPDEPALALIVLKETDGEELCDRCFIALRQCRHFAISMTSLRQVLDKGIAIVKFVECIEALARAQLVGERLSNPSGFELAPASRRGELRVRAIDARLPMSRELGPILMNFFLAICEPEPIEQACKVLEQFLDRTSSTQSTNEDVAIEAGLKSLGSACVLAAENPSLVGPFLELLIEGHRQLWEDGAPLCPRLSKKNVRKKRKWFQNRQENVVVPLAKVLGNCADKAVTRKVFESGSLDTLQAFSWSDPERYSYCADLLAFSQSSQKYERKGIAWIVGGYRDVAAAREAIDPIVTALQEAGENFRRQIFYDLLCAVDKDEWRTRGDLRKIHAITPHVIRYARRADSDRSHSYCIDALFQLRKAMDWGVAAGQVAEWAAWTCAWFLTLSNEDISNNYNVEEATELAARLSGGNFAVYKTLLPKLVRVPDRFYSPSTLAGFRALRPFAGMMDSLARELPRSPRRLLLGLERIGMALKFDPQLLSSLQVEENGALGASAVDGGAGDSPTEITKLRHRYHRARKIAELSVSLPRGALKASSLPERLREELEYLESAEGTEPRRAERMRRLRQRLADRDMLDKQIRRALQDCLLPAVARAEVVALEALVRKSLQARLEKIAGTIALPAVDDDWMNAALLSMDIDVNRALLRQLIRAEADGENCWRERHPANARFLESLIEADVDVGAWLAPWNKLVPCSGAASGRVRLVLETDPLRILQMGNYFYTCLSVTGCNSFSTVANACELNKRIVYASDGLGRIVGRQLIGLNENRELIGFHVYTSLSKRESNERLCSIFHEYVAEFANRCGLRLGNSGTVPRLFATDWYDDGVVAWPETSKERKVRQVTKAFQAPSTRSISSSFSKLSPASSHCLKAVS